jgi:uncharacterized repeat protein (TIGR01451 family)
MGIALNELSDPPILWVADGGNRMVRAYNTSTWAEDTSLSFSTASTGKGPIGMGMDRRRGIIYWGSMRFGAYVPPYAGSSDLYKFDLNTRTLTSQTVAAYDPYYGRLGEVVDVSVDEDTGLVYITETSHMSVWDTSTSPWTMLQRHYFGPRPATCGLVVTNVSYMPDLAIEKTDDVEDDDCARRNIQYTVSYENTGEMDLTGVDLVDDLPSEVDFVSASGLGYYNATDHQVIWKIGPLAEGATGSAVVDVRVNASATPGSEIINYATIESNETAATTVHEKTFICEVISVALDIKPGSCPNPLETGKKGVTPVAILGTEDFDVTEIDPATVLLEGVAPLRWSLEDVATPYTGEVIEGCEDCTTDRADGQMDLTLKFDTPELVAALEEPLEDRECRVLMLSGYLTEEAGGTEIEGVDVVRIQIGKGKKAKKPALVFGTENYPDPANPSTTIRYTLPEPSDVRLTIYNILGQEVRVLVNASKPQGVHNVVWDGRDAFGRQVTSGIYLYRLIAGENMAVRKIALIK